MELSPYLQRLADDLAKVTALADDSTRETTAKLVSAIEPSLRMALVEAISDTAAIVTADLEGVVAVVRMEGRDPVIAVEHTGEAAAPITVPPTAEEGEEDSARITLRLPQSLKQRAESRAADADQSLNTWIVQAIRREAQDSFGAGFPYPSPPKAGSRRVTGWA